MWNPKRHDTGEPNLQNRKRLSDLENKLTVAGAKGIIRGWDGHVHTAVFNIDNQQRPAV